MSQQFHWRKSNKYIIFNIYYSVAPWLLPPNELTCAMRHFLHPLAMVHCISILLVKAMQLRSMAFVGLGGKISQVNQLVCLLFMLLVQVGNINNNYF